MPFLLLMPSYNQAHYIAEAVHSILQQSDPDWQLWIVDNSSDDTVGLMKSFVDPRIRFHHFAERMCPGSCLNWMLLNAQGREFSYVHTDNNLHPDYVRLMRAALSKPLSLAYCDVRCMDDEGQFLHIFRRGQFDMERLLSTDTLGVPFAATTALAQQLGGFSENDYADDVKFCVSALGLASYEYVPEVLVDYRLHSSSRTVDLGGQKRLDQLFVKLSARLIPQLEQRGCSPLPSLAKAISGCLNDADYLLEDFWYRKGHRYADAWWRGRPSVECFFFAGLVQTAGFTSESGLPARDWGLRDSGGKTVAIWRLHRLQLSLRRRRHELDRILERARSMLLTWAYAKSGLSENTNLQFRIRNFGFRTLWAAAQLQSALGWTPLIDTTVDCKPSWLRWQKAHGTEPLLDCSREVTFSN